MADILFAERMKNTISEWRTGLLGGGNLGSKFQGSWSETNQKFQTTFFQTRPALAVNGLTSRQLKLIKLVYLTPLHCMFVLDQSYLSQIELIPINCAMIIDYRYDRLITTLCILLICEHTHIRVSIGFRPR